MQPDLYPLNSIKGKLGVQETFRLTQRPAVILQEPREVQERYVPTFLNYSRWGCEMNE
jgi:hypothetical protein